MPQCLTLSMSYSNICQRKIGWHIMCIIWIDNPLIYKVDALEYATLALTFEN